MTVLKSLRTLGVGLAFGLASTWAQADNFPEKTINLIVPYAAGGGADTIARQLAQHMSDAFGQPVVVDNKPGGATVPASSYVARQAADGYTIFLTGGSTMSLLPLTFDGPLPFSTTEDFDPIGMISRIPMFIAVGADTPYHKLDDLIQDAKTRPGEITFASNGVGSFSHLATETLAEQAGIELTHAPYQSFTHPIPDLTSGRVTMMTADLAGVNPSLQSESVRLLGVTDSERSRFQKEVPTIAESGFPGYEVENWLGLFAPAGVPEPVMGRLGEELRRYINQPETIEFLNSLGHEADDSDGNAVRQRIQTEQEMFQPVVESVGIKDQ